MSDEHENVRWTAVDAIAEYFSTQIGVFEILCDIARNFPFIREYENWHNPRQIALKALLTDVTQFLAADDQARITALS